MEGFQQTLRIGVIGVVAIGLVTALFMGGRTTVAGFNAVGTQTNNIFRTAVTGK